MALRIVQSQLDTIYRHGERTYPHECCGLLLGPSPASGERPGERCVTEAFPMRNANTATPHNRFDFDPQEHLAAQRAARERGLDILGFYHSHPDHPARPSQFDLDHAAWPGYSYLIVSIRQGRSLPGEEGCGSFELADDRSQFLREAITTVSASNQ